MSKLKPCPFCGSKALTNIFLDYEDIENPPTEVTCENERCIYGWWLSPKDWNTRPIEDTLNARIAELEAVIEILEDQQREVKNHLIDKNLHIDSLYEEGYKLQQRIAELEADNAEFRQLIHDWIIILTPDDGYVPDSECVRQAMLVIDKVCER